MSGARRGSGATGTSRPALPMAGPGHAQRASTSPFAMAAPSLTLAGLYALAVVVWLAIGDRLPGGRWLAVHLFTLGVLTNLVLTFSEHFGRTVTRTPGERAAWWPAVTNLGILLVLVGLPTGQPIVLAVGATVVTTAVFASYRRLRRMRHASVGARFVWVARAYERAHGAFVHGAVLGALLGLGLLPGVWYLGGRLAHLHANLLGWGGLTLLATLVFFGPTMARTRIEDGADARAARALRHGATGLSVAVLALLGAGFAGVLGVAARSVAAAGLAVLAWSATVVCLPLFRAVRRSAASAPRWLVLALSVWLPVVVWVDVVVVAVGAWRWLDALGLAAIVGVLAHAIVATLTYLAPMLRGRTPPARERIRARLDRFARVRVGVLEAGAVGVVVAATPVVSAPWLARAGWVAIVASLLLAVVLGGLPVPRAERAPLVAAAPGSVSAAPSKGMRTPGQPGRRTPSGTARDPSAGPGSAPAGGAPPSAGSGSAGSGSAGSPSSGAPGSHGSPGSPGPLGSPASAGRPSTRTGRDGDGQVCGMPSSRT
jgi:hypothetical protein